MDTELISKKELLAAANISYGQLYRWKRKGLIPEAWFIKKSSFTGQETFLPRDKVLARVEKIKSMKSEDLSLDDIADAVSPSLAEVSLTLADVRARKLVSEVALEVFSAKHSGDEPLPFGELVSLSALDTLLKTGDVSLDEGRVVLEALDSAYPAFEGRGADLLFVRKLGMSTAVLVTASAEVRFEPAARVVARLSLAECAEALSASIR